MLTAGYQSTYRNELPGTLINRPYTVADNPVNGNDSRSLGRTVTLSYVNGWLVVGAESPGSAEGSDQSLRIYDISNPSQIVRRRPSHFGHTFSGQQYNDINYPNDFWYIGSAGWNAHGSAQSGPYWLPLPVLHVQNFGGMIALGGQNGYPNLAQLPLGYNRSSQAGPWEATMFWYQGSPNQMMQIRRLAIDGNGQSQFIALGAFDHVGNFGGGDWHPMFFGDLLIYARSGFAANDGIVVYRLEYADPNDDGELDAVTPHYVDSLQGGFEGYWPNLFSDGNGLHVIGSATNILTSAEITGAVDPADGRPIQQGPVLPLAGFSNASYPVYQDNHAFIHNRKIHMTDYLAGQGQASVVLTLNEQAEGVDTTQMSLPLGNLWITGGYPNGTLAQGMAIWVHQQEPDTTRPRVTYHVPQANRANYPRFAPLSFLLHEQARHGGLRNGVDFAVRPVLAGGALGSAVPGYLIHDFSGVVTFTPSDPLNAQTTYQVDFFSDNADPNVVVPGQPIGFYDTANNPIEPYSFRFSTGDGVDALPMPDLHTLVASEYQPEPGESFTVTATASGTGTMEYRFNFEGVWSETWSTNSSEAHIYPSPGRHRVLVQARDASGMIVTRPLNVLVLNPPQGVQPTQSRTLAIGEDGAAGRCLWVVNPDANSVSVLDADDNTVLAEHAVGSNPRGIARDVHGRYWITCMQSDEIRVLDASGATLHTVALPYGSAPFGVAPSPDGQFLYVSLSGSGRIHRYAASDFNAAPLVQATFPTPRALAVSADGTRVLVTRFISPELEGQVAEFHGTTLAPVRTFSLAYAISDDNGDRAAGVPNYLSSIAISPDGRRAAVVSKQDNIQRGELFGVPDLSFENTVRAVVSFLDLENHRELPHSRRDFDNSDSPSAVTYSPLGDTVWVTLQGNNRLVGFDVLALDSLPEPVTAGATLTSPVVKILDVLTGLAPQGVLIDPVSQRVFVQNFMGRSVTVINGQPILAENRTILPILATPVTVADEPLSDLVVQGKRLFYNAADARMSAEGYISCASCHVDGGHDGRVWDFTGRGEGLRRTTDLRGRAGTGHGNVHWSGNFDEIQDFEHDIRGPFGGTGFLDDANFATNHPSPASSKAGLSQPLDALAAYVASLDVASVPRSPERAPDGTLSAEAMAGREHFQQLQCATCHAGPNLTDSMSTAVANAVLRDVGTLSSYSGGRLGAGLEGIDTPTLQGLHASGRYLHHGRAESLQEVFTFVGGSVLQAEDAEHIGGGALTVEYDAVAAGGGGPLRGVLGGALVHVGGSGGAGVRFVSVNGGTGGLARLSIRHILRGNGTTRLRINGVEQMIQLLGQAPDNGWMTSGWRWLHVDIDLEPGTENHIEILRSNDMYADFQLDAVEIANADDLLAAQPHRIVHSLNNTQRAELLAYLTQLDGSPGETPAPYDPSRPTVSVNLAPGAVTPVLAPFVDIEIVFSSPVSGFTADDVSVTGTSGASLRRLDALPGGAHYRLRLAGFSQAGELNIHIPEGVAESAGTTAGNFPSSVLVCEYAPHLPDDLAGLSDEFDSAVSLGQWQRNEFVEGWGASKLEQWDINTSTPGHMRLMPYASSWYQDFTGAYTYKLVTGDFVLTTQLNVTNRAGTGRPNADFSLAGLMVRAPRGIVQAAPQPSFSDDVVLPWPPPAPGQTNHYSTDWAPGTENYIFLSFGFGSNALTAGDPNNPNRWHYEVKTTTNGISTLYPATHGVPENQSQATLQMVRRGATFLLLRRHGNGPWVLENRFHRPDLPQTLQVGLTCYSDWNTVSAGWNFVSPVQPFHQNRIVNTDTGNPDLIADVDFLRLRRPDPALTELALQSLSVTGQYPVFGLPSEGATSGLILLANSPLASLLGDAASAPYEEPGQSYETWLGQVLSSERLLDPAWTAPLADPLASGMPNLLHYLMGAYPATMPAIVGVPNEAGMVEPRFLVTRNPQARGWRLLVETTTNFAAWQPVAWSDQGSQPTGLGLESELPGPIPTMIVGPDPAEAGAEKRFYRVRALPLP